MKKSNLIPKQKYIRRRTVDGKKMNNCENCIYNDDGLCDRKGILVEDEDTCDKWSEGQTEWEGEK